MPRRLDDARPIEVTLISTLPPHMGVADYTAHLVGGLAQVPTISLEVVDFASLYPRWVYPGGKLRDPTARRPQFPNVRIRTLLSWYNPLSWIFAGLTLRGRVVHAQWWSYALAPVFLVILGIARLRRRKIVMTVHNVEPHEGGRLRRFLNKLVLGLAHVYVVHTTRSFDSLVRQGTNSERIAIIPMGVLTSPGRTPSTGEARRALGVQDSAKVVLHFGNVRPYKGVSVLLRAFAKVRARVPGALLLIAGSPWEDWAPYEALIDELRLTDAVQTQLEFVPAEQVATLFAAADLVVLPYTHFDAQSAVGAQALHYGKALVVSDVGGLPELVADSRFVVPPADVARLAEALTEVLMDDEVRQRLEDGARQLARELQWDAIGEKTAALYHALADGAAGNVQAASLAEERSSDQK